MSRQDSLQVICDDLCNNLVQTVAKGDGSEVIEGGREVIFRDKVNEGGFDGRGYISTSSTVLHNLE